MVANKMGTIETFIRYSPRRAIRQQEPWLPLSALQRLLIYTLDIADQLAAQLFDISGLFIIVIGALITEKVFLRYHGISFGIVLPWPVTGICLLVLGRVSIKTVATKLAIFAVMFSIAIPASIGVSQLVDGYFEQSELI
jgi:hypothetical protein